MSRARRIATPPAPGAPFVVRDAGQNGCPQGLRPEIARIIEALARAAVHREDRQSLKSAGGGAK